MTGLFPKKTFVVSDGFHLQGCNRVLYDKKKHFRKGTPDRLISLWNCKKVNYAKLFRSCGRRF